MEGLGGRVVVDSALVPEAMRGLLEEGTRQSIQTLLLAVPALKFFAMQQSIVEVSRGCHVMSCLSIKSSQAESSYVMSCQVKSSYVMSIQVKPSC